MAESAVLVAKNGGILRLTLNRPDRLNSLNKALFEGMMAALEDAAMDDQCRVVVLTGAGRGFCAGQDLSGEVYNANGPQPDVGIVIERYNAMIEAMRRLPKPIVGAVNGIAAGGGASLAFACDIVIAKKSASFLQAFAKIGLVSDCGSTYFLPRLAGEARARGMALLAEPIKAEQAEAWGLIWKAVDDAAFDAEVSAVADKLAAAATYGLALTKQALLESGDNDLSTQLRLERDLQRKAAASPDYLEGVGAFLAKRPAKFTGSQILMTRDAQEIARLSAAAMWDGDKASPALGMELLDVGPGRARIAMTVAPTMVNGLGICHGGFIFTLADSACAFASNSYNQRAVLQTGEIFLIAPAKQGMRLIAEAGERHRGDRSGIYDVAVRSEGGETIAEFRGHVRTIPGTLF